MNVRPQITRQITRRDNGGPPLDDDGVPRKPPTLHIGEKFLCLFKPARHYALFGGRGSGKSHAVATVLLILAAKYSLRIVCARQFQNSIKESVRELLEIKAREIGLWHQFTFTEREIVHKATGSRFTFIGLDRNPGSAKSLEGADICWVEEARYVNAHSIDILIPTIRKPGSRIIWTWNPEFREDAIEQYFRGPVARPDAIVQQVGIEDNPFFYHTAMPMEMWHMQHGNPTRYKHVWLGDYDDAFDTKVFSNVRIGRVEVPRTVAPRYGMDFGFGAHPSAVVKLYVMEAQRVIYITREFYGSVPLRDLPAGIRSVVDDETDYIKADSAQPGTIEHLNSQGFNLQGARKGPGSVKAGINYLQSYQIVIDPDCPNMITEARLYTWQVDKITRKRLSVPVDAHNHLWDSVRYATEDQMEDVNVEQPNSTGAMRIPGF